MARSVFGLEDKELLKFAKKIKLFGAKDFPVINGMALNQAAFETRKESVRIAEMRFTMRNKWTVKSIQFEKVRGLDPRSQFSVVGSIMDYMEQQEFGHVIKKTGSKGVAIPTTTASAEPFSARPRRKQVVRSRRRTAIKLSKASIRAKNRKQYIFLSIRAAAAKGSGRFIYLPIQNSKGIYRVTGKGKRANIKMIYDLSRPVVTLEKKPWFNPAINNIIPRMPVFYKKAFEKRVKKAFSAF